MAQRGRAAERVKPAAPAEIREPLSTLGLEWPVSLDAVKSRYKELAKRHHPDANGGDRASEERLKTINLAYAAVRNPLDSRPLFGCHRVARFAALSRPSRPILLRNPQPMTRRSPRGHASRPPTSTIDAPDTHVSAREVFGIDVNLDVPAFSGAHRARARPRPHLPVRPRDHGGDPGRVQQQPPGADPGLPRHGQVDPHRAGGGAAELAVHPRQPGQPHQPHRPDRQGTPSWCATASRSPSSARASCPGRCSMPAPWCSTSTTPAGRT